MTTFNVACIMVPVRFISGSKWVLKILGRPLTFSILASKSRKIYFWTSLHQVRPLTFRPQNQQRSLYSLRGTSLAILFNHDLLIYFYTNVIILIIHNYPLTSEISNSDISFQGRSSNCHIPSSNKANKKGMACWPSFSTNKSLI